MLIIYCATSNSLAVSRTRILQCVALYEEMSMLCFQAGHACMIGEQAPSLENILDKF